MIEGLYFVFFGLVFCACIVVREEINQFPSEED